ncbi:YerC/YecD family TrpR-related protein [Dialister micraerophilus]|uniref:TrpR family protein YerC/YecD n=1 Tax=Dialister micraerophilus UPII 345-E TaxID=910314 RepID=E4L775_9FIRM|nr:YerC/YecD family TrpR-related protein [Dialister micraerophilus]EFR43350.1 TrpR family protein YerC/YecD [Dialister micraerophilus UPII 345-E]
MDIKNPTTSALFEAVSKLQTENEFYSFFEDLCTVDELLEMTNRFRIAKMLYHGKKYNEIQKLTGCSMGTISRINRTFKYGNDGYKLVFERLNQSTSKK